MPIRQALGQVHSFSPDEISNLDDAFTAVLTTLGIPDRNDDRAHAVAKVIIDLARQGKLDPRRDPRQLCTEALKRIDGTSN
jgi:hypothetical protein